MRFPQAKRTLMFVLETADLNNLFDLFETEVYCEPRFTSRSHTALASTFNTIVPL